MAEPDFIVPPPGLIPEAPSEAPDRTARDAPPRVLPSFPPPPGAVPAPAPSTPPGSAASDAPPTGETRIEAPTTQPVPGAWRLRGDGGVEVLVLRPIVLGRHPATDAAPVGAAPVALTDPARSVSKTHALVEVVADELVVTDLHSTNGITVEASDGRSSRLEPGLRTSVPGGATLLLGEFALLVDRVPLDTV
ncbi:FHA domain-containing protein [Agromyces sp. Marseille-P2726]|uniref:FHA domain-containing protein n=1 Tax=Agromyces sp. Marseille-P2726 TaxID=2709132 RepID=UPI00156EC6E9|nr:FHA domain-containing protein [Agromyces sp. Marseille-P2726]